MAIPDSPLTRPEEYLNNIATGEGAIPDVPLTRIEQYLDYIAKNGGSGGGGSGGGGEPFVITATSQDEEDETKGTVDKTSAEILEAINAGKNVYFSFPSGRSIALTGWTINSRTGVYAFTFSQFMGDEYLVITVVGGRFSITIPE